MSLRPIMIELFSNTQSSKCENFSLLTIDTSPIIHIGMTYEHFKICKVPDFMHRTVHHTKRVKNRQAYR